MQLAQFSDLYKVNEFDEVDFIAKITSITFPTDIRDRVIIHFFDGFEHNRFIVYTDNQAIREILYTDTVYHLYGVARGIKRRYFMLRSFEPVDITMDIEIKYYPERFKQPTDIMKLVYNTSIAKIKQPDLRRFVGYCLGIQTSGYNASEKQEIKYKRFLNSPASISHHDSYPGGFIAHVSGMLSIVDHLEELYGGGLRMENVDKIDWDLLRAIVYLHDIGKPLTYAKDYTGSYIWNEMCLEDHAQLGAQYLYSCWERSKILDYATIQKILYCVSEHMNYNKQFEDKKVPELRILRAIDNLDTAIVTMIA